MKKMKKIIIMLSMLIAALTMVSCSKEAAKDEVVVEKPAFETQLIEDTGFTYEIPVGWAKVEGVTTNAGQTIYAPSSADLTKGTSSVNIVISKVNSKAVSLEDFKTQATTELKKAILSKVSATATDFNFGDFKAPIADVFTMDYTTKISGITMKNTQYYPLIDNYTVVVTGTDIGDNYAEKTQDVAKHIVNTIKKK